jgi:hypothetical protein
LRARTLVDLLLLLWALAWVLMGIAVANETRDFAAVTDNARDAGAATQRAGELLEGLTDLPLVGERLREPAETIQEAGRNTVEGAVESRERAEGLANLLGFSIAVIPSLPLLLFYVPGRLAAERDRRSVRSALREPGAGLEELLAARAVAHLPYHRLLAVSADPLADLRDGRHTGLADAELARLGLSRSGPGR